MVIIRLQNIICFLIIALVCQLSFAQTNNTIVIGDATNDFNSSSENLGTEASRTGYITWDATNIYIGIEGNPIVNNLSNLWVVIDTDPATNDDPRSGNGRTDQPNFEAGGATYPFNADVIYKFNGTSSDDGSIQNPADGDKWTISSGNWTSSAIAVGVRNYRQTSSISDFEIPFSDIGIASGDYFNIIIYAANNGTDNTNNNFLQYPTNNPNGHALTDANGGNPLTHYYTYQRTTGITTNSDDNLSIRTYANSFTFGESSLANLALIGGGQTYSCGSLTSISQNMYIGSGATFDMGTNIAALDIQGNINIIGTLNLSNAVGGDLSLGGNWTNSGTFNDNFRQVTINGTSDQTITNASGETFSFLALQNTGGNIILENNVEVTRRFQFNTGNTANLTTSNSSTITISNDVPDDTNNGIVRNGNGFVQTTIIRTIGTSTGDRIYPVGAGANYRELTLSVSTAPTISGNVQLTYTNINSVSDIAPINDNGTNIIRLSDSKWDLSTTTLSGGNYGLQLRGDGLVVTDVTHLRVSLATSIIGTHSTGTGTNTNPEANRITLSQSDLNNIFYIGTEDLASPLPVELTKFEGKILGNQIQLDWQTVSEENSDYFEIQKSTDGFNFETIGVQQAAGFSNENIDYLYFDNTPNYGQNYYRLKQIDLNNDFEYSNIINIKYQKAFNINIYPNPVNDILNISTNFINEKLFIKIYNSTGQLILNQSYQPQLTLNQLDKGLYFFQILMDNQVVFKELLVVQ